MATLPPSITMQAHSLNKEVIRLMESPAYHFDRSKGTHNANKVKPLRRNRISWKCISDAKNTAYRIYHLKACAVPPSSLDKIWPPLGTGNETEVVEKASTYLFRTEIGGLVKVVVGRKNTKYAICIEVSSLPQWSSEHNLVLSWGIFRSDASRLMVLSSQSSVPKESKFTSETTIETPFVEKSLGRHAVELEFDSNQAPFYLSFLLYTSLGGAAGDSGIRNHRKTSFCVPVGIGSGHPMPLGISFSDGGSVNFSLFSRNAERVVLCLYDEMANEPSLEIDLDPYVNRTGDVWHVSMESIDHYVSYGFRCKGDVLWDKGGRFNAQHVLLDPYAKILGNFVPDRGEFISLAKCLGRLCKEPPFDWTGHVRPCLPLEELVVYRLNVGQFTKDKSSQLPRDVAGTFTGLIKKLDHFKALGVNAILLEPIFPFDKQKGPYLPYHFFSPLNSYGSACDGVSAISSMKEMVKTFHANGIEVLLEVVFTGTAEGGDAACQTISFRGIDNSSYYIVNSDAESSSDNALNCNHPVVQRMILDSLQYWVTEFHIDGFCFMNAAALTRGLHGEYLSRPPLVEAIAFDPILSETKIIADCWSPVDMSCDEIQFPHWKRWAEMNMKFCHDVRNFLRGEGLISGLATRLCGSGDLFSDGRGPAFSFNFIARNSGFHLVDLVSFSSSDLSQLSWNCGEEGPTNNVAVLERRMKQIRNFLFILFISLGVPVLNMGDECGQSTGGSPSYADRKPFNWNMLKTNFAIQIMHFIAFLSSFRRRRSDLLQKRNFMKVENINWSGNDLSPPKWEDPLCKFLAMTLKTDEEESSKCSDRGDLFIVFNAGKLSENIILPRLSEMEWLRLVDTSLPFPGFFSADGEPTIKEKAGLSTYEIKPHSCALFEAKRSSSQIV